MNDSQKEKRTIILFSIIFLVLATIAIVLTLEVAVLQPQVKTLVQGPTEQTIDNQLWRVSKEINKRTPFPMNRMVTLDNTMALPDRIFQYNVSVALPRDNVDSAGLRKSMLKYMQTNLATDPAAKIFRHNKVTLQFQVFDSSGKYITMLELNSEEY